MAPERLSAIAATAGPGLVGGLLVGHTFGRGFALARGLPFLAINHLEGHALTPRLLGPCPFPYLLLLISGGHTQFQLVKGVGDYQRLGTTIDDALGEAFDKTAKLRAWLSRRPCRLRCWRASAMPAASTCRAR